MRARWIVALLPCWILVSACGVAPPAPHPTGGEQEGPLRAWFEELTRGIGERPIPVERPEGTCGVLEVGWNERVLPILASEAGVFVAASTLGAGRIVAFSGQDFLGSDEDATFIGIEGNDTLVRNAVRWASGPAAGPRARVLVDNPAVAELIAEGGWSDVRVASILERRPAPADFHAPLRLESRDWSTAALAGIDVAVVLVNEWDCTHVGAREIASLRAFVERGGGLLIAGSSFHYCLGEEPDFPGNVIVAGSGLRFGDDEEPDLASARLVSGPLSSPVALWQAYLDGESLGAADLARLPDVFASVAALGRVDEVHRALRRLLAETPELPVSAADPKARLSADVAMALGPLAWPAAHPWAATFPGLPDRDAERIERVVEVDTSWTGTRPLGLYAPPGELVTLRFAEGQASLGSWVAVGDEHDDLRSNDRHVEWRRAPWLIRHWRVDAPVVVVSSPYGGPLYLVLPDGPGARSPGGRITVTVQGAIAMAVYTLGESRMQDWERDLGRGAPQAILQARGRVRLVVPTAEAAKVDDPQRMLEFWSGFHASHASLAQEPAPRRFESHWVFDPQVGHGYANTSSVVSSMNPHGGRGIGRVVLPLECLGDVLTTKRGADDYWTIGHELGHQFQTDDWTGGDLTEVAVNLFTMYTKNGYIHGRGEFETAGNEGDHNSHEELVDFRWDDVDGWGKLQLYRQLVLCFGWTAFKRTFASYYDPAYPREVYGGHIDGFAIRFSAIVQRDLTGFFRHWEYPLSEEAVARIRSFGYETWMPPGWPAAGDGREGARGDPLRGWFDELTRGVGERPIPVVRTEGSCGVLQVNWNEHVLPILASDRGVFVAASTLGEGRVVAFSGQDFFCSDAKSTFLGIEGNDALVCNAVRWASRAEAGRQPRIQVDNRAVAELLEGAGWSDVRVAPILERRVAPIGSCPFERRDWTAGSLAGIDVAVVLVNEWDCTHVGTSEIASLRAFVERGGGLLIAGSSFHYCLEEEPEFLGNLIVAGSGIRFDDDEERDVASARVAFEPLSPPVALWQAYLAGEPLSRSDMAQLPDVFGSVARMGRAAEVQRALERLLAETPELPVAATDPRARLSADVAMSLGPCAWPAAHPWAATFPGVPAPDAERIERAVEVDTSWTGLRPLGLYAPPGELVTLRFAAERTGDGLEIAVGDDHDDLRSSCEDEEWRRAPVLVRSFAVDAPVVPVCNPYGGPLYLHLPDGPGALPAGASLTVTVRGAIAMAVYTLGESRMQDWERDLGRGAPQAILQARGRVRLVVPTAEAGRVDDPQRILEFWSGFHASHAELAREPAPRRFESHWIFDPQMIGGYGALAWPSHVNFDMDYFLQGALTTETGEDDYWGFGHELGHQFQTDDWTGGDLTEVAVNLFTLYTKNRYIHGGGEFGTAGWEDDHCRHEDLVDFRWNDEDGLHPYRQLVLCFGWTAFQRTFASYYDPAYLREVYGGHLDGFAIRFSAIVQRDLTGFFQHWEYPLSEQAVARIRSFGYEAWMPPGWPAAGEEGR